MMNNFFYAALAVAPLIAAPIQLLYLKSGKRYDIGAVFFVAVGSFAGAFWGQSDLHQIELAKQVLIVLLPLSLAAFVLRIIALAFFEPMIFTLVSLAQLWSIQPLVAYALARKNNFSVYIGQLLPASMVVILSMALNVLFAAYLSRARLPSRLRAASDSPIEYSILMGSRLQLAVYIESAALVVYLIAGIAFRMVHANLSPEDFGGEGIWMLLSVAALPRFNWKFIIFGPLMVVALRYAVASQLAADYSAIISYALLSMVLAISALYEVKTGRVQRA